MMKGSLHLTSIGLHIEPTPLSLAKDVMQVFYAMDNKDKGRLHVALEEKEDCRRRWSDGRRGLQGLSRNACVWGERIPTYP